MPTVLQVAQTTSRSLVPTALVCCYRAFDLHVVCDRIIRPQQRKCGSRLFRSRPPGLRGALQACASHRLNQQVHPQTLIKADPVVGRLEGLRVSAGASMWRIPDLQETGSPRRAARTCSEGCSEDAPLAERFRQGLELSSFLLC